MSRKKFIEIVENWSVEKRIQEAKKMTQQLTNHIQPVIKLHETNKLVVYSDLLAKQIPRSRASVAFNNLATSLHQYEILRICTFWDRAENNNETIMSVIALIDDDEVIETLKNKMIDYYSELKPRQCGENHSLEIQNAIIEQIRQGNIEIGKKEAEKLKVRLKQIKELAENVRTSPLYESVELIRNRDIAHNLTITYKEKRSSIEPMKYGYETELLRQTIGIVQELYLWVNGCNYDISGDCVIIAKKQAEELWKNITFNIPE